MEHSFLGDPRYLAFDAVVSTSEFGYVELATKSVRRAFDNVPCNQSDALEYRSTEEWVLESLDVLLGVPVLLHLFAVCCEEWPFLVLRSLATVRDLVPNSLRLVWRPHAYRRLGRICGPLGGTARLTRGRLGGVAVRSSLTIAYFWHALASSINALTHVLTSFSNTGPYMMAPAFAVQNGTNPEMLRKCLCKSFGETFLIVDRITYLEPVDTIHDEQDIPAMVVSSLGITLNIFLPFLPSSLSIAVNALRTRLGRNEKFPITFSIYIFQLLGLGSSFAGDFGTSSTILV